MPSSNPRGSAARRARAGARTLRGARERRVEQHARLGVAALLLLAHHQLAAPAVAAQFTRRSGSP